MYHILKQYFFILKDVLFCFDLFVLFYVFMEIVVYQENGTFWGYFFLCLFFFWFLFCCVCMYVCRYVCMFICVFLYEAKNCPSLKNYVGILMQSALNL